MGSKIIVATKLLSKFLLSSILETAGARPKHNATYSLICSLTKHATMAQIQASVEINAPVDKVWSIISDLDSEPKFWKGTKEVRNISKQDNIVTREVTIAFKDSKCMQTVTLYPKEKIQAEFTKGVINGTKTISISPRGNGAYLEAVWDIKLSGMMGMFTGMVKKHIQSGTEQALQSIKQEAER